MRINAAVLFICLLLLFACNTDDPNQENQSPTTNSSAKIAPTDTKFLDTTPEKNHSLAPTMITAKLDSLVKKGGGPCKTGSDCMTVRVVWPVVEGGNPKICKMINDSIHHYVVRQLNESPEQSENSLEKITDNLIQTYKEEYEQNKEYIMGWAYEVDGSISFHKNFANVELANYTFMGGAHPNHYVQYLNFDTKTGKLLTYSDVIQDTEAFENMVKEKFLALAAERIGEEVSIDEFFWGSGFELAKNFMIREQGIELVYNPYEAAAYAFGSFVIEIPYEDLKGFIQI